MPDPGSAGQERRQSMSASQEEDDSRALTPEMAAEQLSELLSSPEFLRAIESEHFKGFLDHLPFGIVVAKEMRGHERIVYSNLAFETVCGLPASDVRGKTWSVLDAYRLSEDPDLHLGHAILTGEEFIGIFHIEKPDTKLTLIEAYVTRVESVEGTDQFRLAVLIDVTDRELSYREQFERQLRDKDMLLRELQHRVRNSLQIIAALIRLESRNAQAGKTPDFDRIASRIQALSILHDRLSNDLSMTVIDLGEYLSRIASTIMESYARPGIRLDMKVDSCPVSISVAMSTGLVVNEVMTNAFKYAFVDRDSGAITLRCLYQGDSCSIVVADDGIGLPEGAVWPPDGKISSLIVQSLQENAKTQLVFTSKPDQGTAVSFVVPTLPSDTAKSARERNGGQLN